MDTFTPVCVARDDRYSDNNGAWSELYMFDGERVWKEGSMYDHVSERSVNATLEQIVDASAVYMNQQTEGYNYNKYCYNMRGANTFVGCIVTLSRSRKAPNNTELTVTNFHESYYDSRYNQHVSEKITISDGTSYWTVSSNCIANVVKGVKEKPFWYKDEKDLAVFKREKLAMRIQQLEAVNPINHLLKIDVSKMTQSQIENIAAKIYRIKDAKIKQVNRLKNKLSLLAI